MYTRILVPMDGTPASWAIIPEICRVFYRTDPELILVQGVRSPPALFAGGNDEPSLAAATAHLLRVEERLSDLGLRARTVVRIGSPARIILETALRERVSLIAMSAQGRKAGAPSVFASVTEKVLRLSPVPLFTVRSRGAPSKAHLAPREDRRIRTLLVPVDASEGSLSVLPHAAHIARLTGARLVLLQAFETEACRRPHLRSDRTPDKFAFDRLREVSEGLHAEGISTHARVDHGDPSRVILESCRFLGADMIAMATRGLSEMPWWVNGRVAEKVLRQALVPVLVVRAAGVLPDVHPQRPRGTVASDHESALVALGRGP